MKNHLLIFLVFISFVKIGQGQIFISKMIVNKILFGPDNLSVQLAGMGDFYLDDISGFKAELENLKNTNYEFIEELKSSEPINKKDFKKLKRLQREVDKIEKELHLAKLINTSWREINSKQDGLLDLLEMIEDGECFEIQTNEGVLFNEEIEIEVVDFEERIEYSELIPIDKVIRKTEFVQVKKEGCVSEDPLDCIQVCGVEKISAIHFKDVGGFDQKLKECPAGFDFLKEEEKCSMEKEFNEDQNIIQQLNLKRKSDSKILSLNSWKKIKC